ncbi:hypothetical protein Tco_1579711 [Tanacetum coccineum]
MQPVAPPLPDYKPGPEDPQTPPNEDNHEFPAEEQPLPLVDSPTAESPGYVTKSDPKEDPEKYEDDEIEDGLVDYPMDGGDDGDDDDGDSSRDNADDEEEEEEHLAPADSTIVIPTDEPVSLPEETEPAIPPPFIDITIRARITVRPQASISLPPEVEVERLLAMTTPSPSPPSLYIPLPVDRRDDIPESEQPPRKRLYLSTLGSRYEVGESSTARPTRDLAEVVPEIAPMTAGEVNTRITELAELYERDIHDLYSLLEDAQDRDRMDGGGGGLCFPRGLGSLDRIESGDSSGASDPS